MIMLVKKELKKNYFFRTIRNANNLFCFFLPVFLGLFLFICYNGLGDKNELFRKI